MLKNVTIMFTRPVAIAKSTAIWEFDHWLGQRPPYAGKWSKLVSSFSLPLVCAVTDTIFLQSWMVPKQNNLQLRNYTLLGLITGTVRSKIVTLSSLRVQRAFLRTRWNLPWGFQDFSLRITKHDVVGFSCFACETLPVAVRYTSYKII